MLKFKGNWRSYQKRILDDLEFHLTDKKLHIVAAPGAGKTTLGAEVIARIGRPSLILCPTNTIKNQWKERICSAFLEEKDYDKVSVDIKNPAYITVTTYQALLAAFCAGKSEDNDDNSEIELPETDEDNDKISSSARFSEEKAAEIINILKTAKISLLCYDEAHHLRKEWWKALNYLNDELQPKQSVALTATPPYDVDYAEWERYEELCGPIDEVISIPELVKNGDLCPHQDFIHFSVLKNNERELLKKHNQNVAAFLERILKDKILFNKICALNILDTEKTDIEQIFDDPQFYASVASYLKAGGADIPKNFLKLFDAKASELPKFNMQQVKILLNGFLITHAEEFAKLEDKIQEYLNLAKHYGLIQNKKFILNESAKIEKQIANSMGKIDSILEITELEHQINGDNLRLVILADYIKEDDADNTHLGVVPIWKALNEKFKTSIKLGILSGSLIVIPNDTVDKLYELAQTNNIKRENITVSKYKTFENYVKIIPATNAKHSIVSIITELFNIGEINVLTGTQALLGEGWDAPSINSLILSSTVSSFMLSNQMRGRAIRKDKKNPDKISNIWHLASVELPEHNSLPNIEIFTETISDTDNFKNNAGLYDLEKLSKRFDGFEAPSYYGKHEIKSGISRIIPENIMYSLQENSLRELNKKSIAIAKDKAQTKKWWDEALYLGYNGKEPNLRTGIEAPEMTAKTLCYSGYKQAFASMAAIFLVILYYILELRLIFWQIFALWLSAFAVAMGYIAIKYIKTGSVAGIMKQIAIVHLETLSYLGYINTNIRNAGITVKDLDGIFVTCENLPTEENNLMIKCMKEFLDPVDNPRYLLIKKDTFMKVKSQTDYFSIPAIISSKKRDVDIFKKLWEKYIGNCEIIYTRNLEGRSILLKARKEAFSATKRKKSKKLSKWQ